MIRILKVFSVIIALAMMIPIIYFHFIRWIFTGNSIPMEFVGNYFDWLDN